MKIAFVGKFNKFHDEEYIARSFESLGHDVIRIEQSLDGGNIHRKIVLSRPDILLFTKWEYPKVIYDALAKSKEWNMKTVCWLFDLYWGYDREFRIKTASYFKADYVFTTDGGNDHKWKEARVNHKLVRQGISKDECYLDTIKDPQGIVFIGSENPLYPARTQRILELKKHYSDFRWLGRNNTDAIRGKDLNKLYSKTKIVVGDSVYSPYYWSNRVVETLGRGGFLIHRDVPGIKEEYPYLVTYDGTYDDLRKKIDYYLAHEDERREIIRKNHKWVLDNYTMDKKCKELISKL